MRIETIKNGTALTVQLEGRLDTSTAPALDAELKTALEGVTALTLDLKDLIYISSAGLRVILSAQKKMRKQGTMVVTNVGEVVMEVFSVTGFTELLTIQ